MNFFKPTIWIVSIVSSIAAPTFFIKSASAGPAMAFVYEYLPLTTKQCKTRGVTVLTNEGLLPPDNITGTSGVAFVGGENEEITVVVGCSEVVRSHRITVMISHAKDHSIALNRARIILDKIKSFQGNL